MVSESAIRYYQPQSKNITISDFYNADIGDAQYLYLIAQHFPERLPKMDALVTSLVDALNNDAINTVMSAYTSLALSAYGQASPIKDSVSISLSKTLSDGKKMRYRLLLAYIKKLTWH